MSDTIFTNRQQKSYAAIDVVKFFMAFVVVAIHTHPLEYLDNEVLKFLYDIITPCAVPFFFLVTGFFIGGKLHGKDKECSDVIFTNSIKKTIRLYIIWSLIYFPLAIWEYMTNEFAWYIDIFLYIRGLLFVGEHFNSWILWYLLSAIYGLFFIRLCMKKNKSITSILFYGTIIFFLGQNLVFFCGIDTLGLTGFAVIVQKALSGVGRLATGVFYISLGLWLSQQHIEMHKKSPIILLLLVGVLLNSTISSLSLPLKYVSTIFCATGIFLITLKTNLSNSSFYKHLRTSSMVIYFTHMWVWTIIYATMYGQRKAVYGMDMFVYTCIGTLILSMVWIRRKS